MAIVMMLYLHFDIFIVYVFTYDVHLQSLLNLPIVDDMYNCCSDGK